MKRSERSDAEIQLSKQVVQTFHKEFVIRGFPVDEEKLARLKSLYGEEVDQYEARRYFDHLTISRITGKFTTHDGDEGVCKESSSPTANKTSSVSTKF